LGVRSRFEYKQNKPALLSVGTHIRGAAKVTEGFFVTSRFMLFRTVAFDLASLRQHKLLPFPEANCLPAFFFAPLLSYPRNAFPSRHLQKKTGGCGNKMSIFPKSGIERAPIRQDLVKTRTQALDTAANVYYNGTILHLFGRQGWQ
jgi:hypothetical protein